MALAKLLALLAALVATINLQPPQSERVLDVAWHHQEHNLSCEAAALKMVLSYYGVALDEVTLMDLMGRDGRPAGLDAAHRLVTWGDPAQAYVGDPDGRIERYQGYGAYHQPVARAAWLAGVSVLESGSGLYGSPVPPGDLYRQVLAGHPSVAWISNTYHQVSLRSYTAYDGAAVRYTLTEHAVAVVGVRPDAVLIDDPGFGRSWHRKAQFEAAYATFAGMAVVIGPPDALA